MRFSSEGPSIPDILLERCDAGRVVFLCGAGVSIPSRMPSFVELTRHIIEFFDPPVDSEIMTAFHPWLNDQSAANIPLDQIFNLLHLEYGKDAVNALVTERLSVHAEIQNVGREHDLIKRISSSQSGIPQIVTTNFDRLFETRQDTGELTRYIPPAFPDLSFGSKIEGITYLHGRLVNPADEHHPYVLSSADFGRAYLAEGWATNFIRQLLERYTVVLVGYQAEDPPIKYLLQGLNHDGQYDRSRLYAFDCGLPEEVEVKWRDRGVTAIAYPDHQELWKSMEAWADRADNPRSWRASIIAKSQKDPKGLAPFERGQVAHVLRTVQGARLFSEAVPTPHPEWICVMDANIRSAKQKSVYSDNTGNFEPGAAYGLDDDLKDISEDELRQGVSNDSLLIWRNEDDNPTYSHRLSWREISGFETQPKRLGHISAWISNSINSPAIAWWAVRVNGLHPRLLKLIEWQMGRSQTLHERARHIWNLIIEYQKDPRERQWNGEWLDLKERIDLEGWTSSVIREFKNITTPRLNVEPPYGLRQFNPPSLPWEEIRLSDLGHWDIAFFDRHNQTVEVPEELLPQIVGILEEQLTVASGILGDIEAIYFQMPTCYPDREIDGEDNSAEAAEIVTWFLQLFDRMAAKWPELARAHAMTWAIADRFFFRKLKLYAFNKVGVCDANYVAEEVLSMAQEELWDTNIVRELLFLLVDRWSEFSQESQNQLVDRILAGPERRSYWSDEDYSVRRDWVAASYARYLELHGGELTTDRRERLQEMIRSIPEWEDGWAISMAVERGSHTGWVGKDETPDMILDLPVNEVVSRARQELNSNVDRFTEKEPFTGLVKINPRKALSALTIAGKIDDFPEAFWSAMINEIPTDISPRLRRVFLNRIARLPNTITIRLRYTLSRWLEQNIVAIIKFDVDLGWAVYDHIVEGIISGGIDATKSSLSEVSQGGKVIQRSRRTLNHAINGPIGMCTEALFHAVPRDEHEADSLIPDYVKIRIELLFSAPGEGADHAVTITARRLPRIMFIDPCWANNFIIPMLELKHSAAEPAWNGLLQSDRMPGEPLAEIIKPLLLKLLSHVEKFSWEDNLFNIAVRWLGYMRVFYVDKPSGLTRNEMRTVLRVISDDNRNRFISWLSKVGQKNEDGWVKYVIPLVSNDWPREHRYMTSTLMSAWIGLLDSTNECFPDVYKAVKMFLVPVEANDHPFYRFTRELGDEEPITVRFPETTLDLMNRVTPNTLTRPPYELPKVLSLIAETKPGLRSDPRYLRLINLIDQS